MVQQGIFKKEKQIESNRSKMHGKKERKKERKKKKKKEKRKMLSAYFPDSAPL